MEELSYVEESAHFWSVGDRKRVFNTVMLIYRHDMSSGLQEYVSIWTLFWLILYLSTAIQLAETVSVAGLQTGGGRVRNAGLPVISGNTLSTVACEYCQRAPSDFFVCPWGSRVQPRQGLWQLTQGSWYSSHHALSLETSWWIGNKNKFFVAHIVNCVICNNHTRIYWMLLNFTPVIQQNYHRLGRKFEKSFRAVDRLSWLIWPVKIQNQPIRKRSCFWYRKLCAFNLLTWGLNVVLRYLTSSDFCVAKILWATNVPESSRCWQHHSNHQITTRLFHILQDMSCDLFVLIF